MLETLQATNRGTVNLKSISEGEELLADRGCRKIHGLSLDELVKNLKIRNMELPAAVFENYITAGAMNCSNPLEPAGDCTVREKLLSRIKCLELQLKECHENIKLLENGRIFSTS
jgi:hypothetical protein